MPIEEGDGNRRAVGRRREYTSGDVEGRIVPARYVVHLQEAALPRLQIVLEDLLGLRHRLVGVAQAARVLLKSRDDLHDARRLAEVDGVLGTVRPTPHENALVTPLLVAFEPDEVIGVSDHVLNDTTGVV